MTTIFEEKLSQIENRSSTAKLWINYFKMVSIFKEFIVAERMGDWNSYLNTIEVMIPFFHAAGNFPYAKSVQLYLQDMKGLEKIMDSEEYEKFTQNGYFTVRRTDKFFSGVHSDQIIEQTLMKSMSVESGPFKRGATDNVVYKWIRGGICTKDILEGIENFCNVSFNTSQQHHDTTDARIKRDEEDVFKLVKWLQMHNPFSENDVLISLASGVTANETINCHKVFEIGVEAMKKIDGLNFKEIKFKRSNKCLPLLAVNSKIKINNEIVSVDPLLLFQRISVLKKSDEELKEFLKYELAPYPLSLFNEQGLRKNTKSSLYDIVEESNISLKTTQDVVYVIDGGMLLHKVLWQIGQKFSAICQSYVQYLKRNYASNIHVVFDGYIQNSTKIMERIRRSKKLLCVDIFFNEDMQLTVQQEKFLANTNNKSKFIELLKKKLIENNILVHKAEDDADTLIVKTAINQIGTTAIISEDTDVLVLLVALCPDGKEIYFLKKGTNKMQQKTYSSRNLDKNFRNCKKNILFIHAFTGCDTTSSFFLREKKICIAF